MPYNLDLYSNGAKQNLPTTEKHILLLFVYLLYSIESIVNNRLLFSFKLTCECTTRIQTLLLLVYFVFVASKLSHVL